MLTVALAVAVVVALVVIVPTIVVLLVQRRVRRQAAAARRVVTDPSDPWYGRPYAAGVEPADQPRSRWATDDVLDVEALRAVAEADGAEAAFVSPGHARVEAFLAEVLGRRAS